jgi:copper chaperone CopZ
LALALLLSLACSPGTEGSDEYEGMMKVTFSVPEMCCSSCAMKTKAALEQQRGVDKGYANFLEKRAWARYDPELVEPERLSRAIHSLGFKEVTVVSVEPYEPEPLPEVY